ncbi:anthranilate synthase component II [Halobacillus mangrovi]|uniref:Aminodeoxychorismate/anthranilate synthase component II n=1 Tax=Halobacillus mangrovi TaxID=402384 RepID=A0A1W5ZRH4_9BACI|nr:aminodeoxychorismate/anthranilate synthase component II [Halobacillus mangrovi]ARI75878.1 aminodeoxychorismate/anthranilate synthase component II [Halobacillus mangrovi]
MILIIDNYDSFTYNLVQYFKQMDSHVVVYRHDKVTVAQIEEADPALIVLSPGPGSPEETGISKEVLDVFHQKIPMLGICLGHQLIVDYFGGKVAKGHRPMHGKVSSITHDGKTVFEGMDSPLNVTRYHSLITPDENLPLSLEVSARTSDGVVMAFRHKKFPIEGIQFHPESILTEYGFEMLENAYRNALAIRNRKLSEVLV